MTQRNSGLQKALGNDFTAVTCQNETSCGALVKVCAQRHAVPAGRRSEARLTVSLGARAMAYGRARPRTGHNCLRVNFPFTALRRSGKRRCAAGGEAGGWGGTDREPVQRMRPRGCCSCGEATVSMRGVAIIGRKAAPSFSQPTELWSRPGGSAPLPVQTKRGLPGLLCRQLLGPRAHECRGPRVAGVALERIAPEEGASATDTDRLLGDRDCRALHGDPSPKSAALINMIAMISE
jgi:hypothetical protein